MMLRFTSNVERSDEERATCKVGRISSLFALAFRRPDLFPLLPGRAHP